MRSVCARLALVRKTHAQGCSCSAVDVQDWRHRDVGLVRTCPVTLPSGPKRQRAGTVVECCVHQPSSAPHKAQSFGGEGGGQLQLVSLAATYDAEGVHVAREHRARWSGVPPQLPSAGATALSHLDRWTDAVDEREAEPSAAGVINQMLSRTTAADASLRQLRPSHLLRNAKHTPWSRYRCS